MASDLRRPATRPARRPPLTPARRRALELAAGRADGRLRARSDSTTAGTIQALVERGFLAMDRGSWPRTWTITTAGRAAIGARAAAVTVAPAPLGAVTDLLLGHLADLRGEARILACEAADQSNDDAAAVRRGMADHNVRVANALGTALRTLGVRGVPQDLDEGVRPLRRTK